MTATCPVAQARVILARWAWLQALVLAGDQDAYLATGRVTVDDLADLARRADTLARLITGGLDHD